MRQLSSTANPEIKHLIHIIEKSKARKEAKTFVVEGERLLSRAIDNGYEVLTIYCLEDNAPKWEHICHNVVIVNYNILSKISMMQYDVVAILRQKKHILDIAMPPHKGFLCLVLSGLEKPGNIGAILRTADASGVHTIFLSGKNADIYSPSCLRNSTGALFSTKIFIASPEDIISYLENYDIPIYTTYLDAAYGYEKIDYSKGGAIVMGTEASGVEQLWIDAATQCIKIPMMGTADSLNVSVSTAIILYEALRQRRL